jgi:glucose-1-phosphate cytidylyltransferase
MKVVLFCGGQGMRMREFSEAIPKPMVPIGTRPVLWHLMRYYAHYGHTDFVICLGYKGEAIKEYFLDYKEWLSNDFVLSEGGTRVDLLDSDIDDWRMTFVDTGMRANIGERLMAVREHLEGEDVFLANYADGLTDAPLPEMLDHFSQQDKVASFLCIQPRQTFHIVNFSYSGALDSIQSAADSGIWINGGFFVFDKRIFDYMRPGEELVHEPFSRLISDDQLTAYRHKGFWAGMDTFKDRQELDDMYQRGGAHWEVWKPVPE